MIVAVAGGLYKLGTASKDTPIGHIIRSAYDYVVSETLGFHVDYNKTLGQQYEELKKQEPNTEVLPQSKFDALIEKCEIAIRDMHRPIVWSETAEKAKIISQIGSERRPIAHPLNRKTFEYIDITERSEMPDEFVGRVSSYNINTFKGRIYIPAENRPVPFELAQSTRDPQDINCITESLTINARTRFRGRGDIHCRAFRNSSKSGRLKGLLIVEVWK